MENEGEDTRFILLKRLVWYNHISLRLEILFSIVYN
jgi:hypothetical protein